MTSTPAQPSPGPEAPAPHRSAQQPARGSEVKVAKAGYLGVIFLGPVIPFGVYAVRARRSPFLRYHAATGVNLSVSCLLYALCCVILGGLLALASVVAGLIFGLLLLVVLWLAMLRYLIRGVGAASRGEKNEIPGWLCAKILS